MESPETAKGKPTVIIDGTCFTLVLERQRGVGLYADANRSRYLRIGDAAFVLKELGFHKRLERMGFPVAKILREGEYQGDKYWIEESLGDSHFTERFERDVREAGEISDTSFARWLRHVTAFANAQARGSELRAVNLDALARYVGVEGMQEERPELRAAIREGFQKASKRIAEWPTCLTHGDLTSHNILDNGVIDFGDHFEGPLGYDVVTAITVPFWFSPDPSFEIIQRYRFSPGKIETYLNAFRVLETPAGTFTLDDAFDDLFFLKANWWSVKNQQMPKLQEWRYTLFQGILERYLDGESLLDYWASTQKKIST